MSFYREEFQGRKQNFTIRNALGTDASAMIRYMGFVDRETTFLAREPGEFEKSYPLHREQAFLKECAEKENILFLLAFSKEGELAATCSCSYPTEKQRYRHRGELSISVRKEFWHQGLGRRLMEIQEAWCQRQNVCKLCLQVDASNTPALGLYLRLGFEVEGTLRREARMADGSYRDLHVMGKFLDE